MAQQPPPPAAAPGSNKKLYTILSWALFPPIGSLIFLFVGKDDADVKYNAAQATVIHGISLIIYIITIILATVTLGILGIVTLLWYVVWLVIWIVGLILALQTNDMKPRFQFPGIGGMTASWTTMVEGWAK
ncbi:MAG TPA: DUF4870 domain-containing protein [Candidatus Acidoferrales bacterium]|nr:DUF4870 domain-containing protein [Candidatus Acidoferrales bacterium]